MRSPSRPFSSNKTSKSSKSTSPNILQVLPNPSHSLTSILSQRNTELSLQIYLARKKLKFPQNTAVTITPFPSKKGRPRLSPAATIAYLQPSSRSWINTLKTICIKVSSAIRNLRLRHQFYLSRNPIAPCDYASITEVSTKSRSNIDTLYLSLLNSSTSAIPPSTSHASIFAMFITYWGWRWGRSENCFPLSLWVI
jgi:hypothetical protein